MTILLVHVKEKRNAIAKTPSSQSLVVCYETYFISFLGVFAPLREKSKR